ncbi:PREDICTED: dentin matrix acidic phosphoprotein 1, partial [Phaethon lepturus]|uniref:dentin matrix acidic phosphoprotein 1 n=1 Tax=Phaethon lepturus TaxID=97097 RepID=UPI00053053C7
DTTSEDYINKLGNLLGGGDGRDPPASAGRGDNALAGDPADGNTVGEELGKHGGRDKGGRVGEAQQLNWVDHEDASTREGNSLGFLEEDARDAADGDNGEHHGTGVNGLPPGAGGLLDEEDDSGDDTFDENGEEEGGEGPTYVAGADRAGEHGRDAGRGDAGAGRGHGDSSSSSSSESIGADHWRQGEESPPSRSGEDGDGEDSPSREGEDSESRESAADQSDEELGESPEDISREVVSTSSNSRSQEGREDPESEEDRRALPLPDSESRETEGDRSKSREDDGDQSLSTEDTMEESKEDENDSDPDGDVPSTSAESQSTSPEDDGSQEDNAGEDSRSTESNNSESQEEEEEDDDEDSHSQEDPAVDYDDNDCQDGY